jgi:hypothetical protein
LLIIFIIALFFGIRWFQKAPPDLIARYVRALGIILIAVVLIILGVTGRLNWVFAAIGIAFAFLIRILPVILRLAPSLHKLWQMMRGVSQATHQQANSRSQTGTTMALEEAYSILGVSPGATKQQVISAHRKLIQKIHPDRGGNDYLAAKINLAKKIILNSLD